jgi:hypothetical protein
MGWGHVVWVGGRFDFGELEGKGVLMCWCAFRWWFYLLDGSEEVFLWWTDVDAMKATGLEEW